MDNEFEYENKDFSEMFHSAAKHIEPSTGLTKQIERLGEPIYEESIESSDNLLEKMNISKQTFFVAASFLLVVLVLGGILIKENATKEVEAAHSPSTVESNIDKPTISNGITTVYNFDLIFDEGVKMQRVKLAKCMAAKGFDVYNPPESDNEDYFSALYGMSKIGYDKGCAVKVMKAQGLSDEDIDFFDKVIDGEKPKSNNAEFEKAFDNMPWEKIERISQSESFPYYKNLMKIVAEEYPNKAVGSHMIIAVYESVPRSVLDEKPDLERLDRVRTTILYYDSRIHDTVVSRPIRSTVTNDPEGDFDTEVSRPVYPTVTHDPGNKFDDGCDEVTTTFGCDTVITSDDSTGVSRPLSGIPTTVSKN